MNAIRKNLNAVLQTEYIKNKNIPCRELKHIVIPRPRPQHSLLEVSPSDRGIYKLDQGEYEAYYR